MSLPVYASTGQRIWYYSFRVICALIFAFLIIPILVIIPLSFNAQDFFTFTPEMLRLDPAGFSTKHYQDFFTNQDWQRPLKNSFIIAPLATIISVSLGTLAAVGLSQSHVPFRGTIMAILISPMIVPLIISATGMFFFYSKIGFFMEDTLGMSKGLVGYIKVILVDEVVVVLFVGSAAQKTLPWQMFTGLREQISPTILAVATVLVAISIVLLATVEVLRRRSERLRGMSPG